METWEERKKREKIALKKKEKEYRKGQWKIIVDIEKAKKNDTESLDKSEQTGISNQKIN